MKLFNESWWTEIYKNSGRDQLSQMFVSWMSDIEIKPIIVGQTMENNEFINIIYGPGGYFRDNHQQAVLRLDIPPPFKSLCL